ncbi:MAG: polymorphic toxin-type HINT domain-containing protein [Planctomycetota bacterium]
MRSPLVDRALDAELGGNSGRRDRLLEDAIRANPDDREARWQAGFVRVDDGWARVDEIERDAHNAKTVDRYRVLRAELSGQPNGQTALALWCRKFGLRDQEQFHWANVLRINPTSTEARQRLRLRDFNGTLMTNEQIEDHKMILRRQRDSAKKWNPLIEKWMEQIEHSTTPEWTDAWSKLELLDEVDAVRPLLAAFEDAELHSQQQIIKTIANIRDQTATDALIQIAVNAREPELRTAAAKQLGKRSWYAFVPTLLSRLETPVSYHYTVVPTDDGVVSQLHFTKETFNNVVSATQSRVHEVPLKAAPKSSRTKIQLGRKRARYQQQKAIATETRKQQREIGKTIRSAKIATAGHADFNRRLLETLATSTGQPPQDARSWWNWWNAYNELEESDEDKRYLCFQQERATRRPIFFDPSNPSCFVAGTPVWTETGALPIETILPGDRVLSQDPVSGELAYRVVLYTTVRDPSETLKISVGGEQFIATLGHPVWVTGEGWKMAKELNVGDRLHSIRGGLVIESIESDGMQQAFNLVVDQAQTYFIGENRILVHDNSMRGGERLPLPGWNPKHRSWLIGE